MAHKHPLISPEQSSTAPEHQLESPNPQSVHHRADVNEPQPALEENSSSFSTEEDPSTLVPPQADKGCSNTTDSFEIEEVRLLSGLILFWHHRKAFSCSANTMLMLIPLTLIFFLLSHIMQAVYYSVVRRHFKVSSLIYADKGEILCSLHQNTE